MSVASTALDILEGNEMRQMPNKASSPCLSSLTPSSRSDRLLFAIADGAAPNSDPWSPGHVASVVIFEHLVVRQEKFQEMEDQSSGVRRAPKARLDAVQRAWSSSNFRFRRSRFLSHTDAPDLGRGSGLGEKDWLGR
ncbi:MAG: hypothetical protein Q9206_003079 [Seirophora lacunosa]